MGIQIVSASHLKQLIYNVPKEAHGLVMSDICPEDRQNFKSLEKTMHSKVLEQLTKHVIDCDGTVMYLRLCKQIVSGLCKHSLSPLERINRLWYSTYFLRAWRKWLKNTYALPI